VPGTEEAELGRDRLQVAQRLPQEHERREKHRLLLGQVRLREERLHGRGRLEQPRVEDLDELLAARRDQVEARFECFEIESHVRSSCREIRHAWKVAERGGRGNAASLCLVVRLPALETSLYGS